MYMYYRISRNLWIVVGPLSITRLELDLILEHNTKLQTAEAPLEIIRLFWEIVADHLSASVLSRRTRRFR